MPVADILIVSDSAEVRAEVAAVLDTSSDRVREATSGPAAIAACRDTLPDLVICDLQVGSMGGMAVTLELRLEESGGRLGFVPVLLLLDRRADVFIARRSEADGWLVKPLDPIRLRRAVTALLADESYHDDSYRPATSAATPA